MGAKVCMLIYLDDPTAYALAQSPTLNGPATDTLVNKLFPHTHLSQVGMGNLAASNPTKGAIYAACFGGLSIVAAEEFGGDHPSKLTQHFLTPGNEQQVVLLAMHSVVDWFAYAYWQRGRLVRALSLAPDKGVIETKGQALPFEAPFWQGERPASDDPKDDYPLPFHPLDLAEEALSTFLGFSLEGPADANRLDPAQIPMMVYQRARAWWKFW